MAGTFDAQGVANTLWAYVTMKLLLSNVRGMPVGELDPLQGKLLVSQLWKEQCQRVTYVCRPTFAIWAESTFYREHIL